MKRLQWRTARRLLGLALGLVCAGVLAGRLATFPRVAEHWDTIHFTNALERYSVLERRPHFPGYPVYVWLGRALGPLEPDPLQRLHLLSVLASAVAVWPLGLLAWRFRERVAGTPSEALVSGLAAPLLWTLAPLAWTGGNEAVSDPPALLLSLTALLASCVALDAGAQGRFENERRATALAALSAGAMLGVRPTYLALLAPLVLVLLVQSACPGPRRRTALLAVAILIAAVAGWLGWQIAVEGQGYFAGARGHLSGHAKTWGGSLLTDPRPYSRPARWLANIGGGWVGRDGLGWLRLAALAVLTVLAGAGTLRLVRARAWAGLGLAGAWLLAYSAGMLLAFDVDLGRYALALLPVLALLAAVGLPPLRLALPLVAGLTLVLGIQTLRVASRHRDAPRLGHRLARWVERRPDLGRDVLLVTGAAPNLQFYLEASGVTLSARPVSTQRLQAEAESLAAHGRRVLATEPAPEAPEDWRPLARFCRDVLTEETGVTELWLYRYAPAERLPATPLACE